VKRPGEVGDGNGQAFALGLALLVMNLNLGGAERLQSGEVISVSVMRS
jgi:hypothetical protein